MSDTERPSLGRPPDAYEHRFMGPGEHILLRDKMSFHPAVHVLMALAVLAGIAGVIGSGAPVHMALLPFLVGLVVLSFTTTLRTTVSAENVHIQYGVIGPTIPIESIEKATSVKYAWWKYGGWGIRYSPIDRSWCYNMIGDGGRAVEILYRKNGKLKKVLVASREPNLLADSISRARSGELALAHEEEMSLDFAGAEEAEMEEQVAAQVERK